MAHHVANEDSAGRVGNGEDIKEIAPDRRGRQIALRKTQRALLRGYRGRKGREFVRQKNLLDLARHIEISLELGVFRA